MHITVQVRSVYGRETVYPACPKAVAFANIAGTKTLTTEALREIHRMGVEIRVEAPQYSMAEG